MVAKWMALLGLALGSAVTASACGSAPGDVFAESTDEDAIDDAELAVLPRCGGFAGLACRVGERCIDLRGDGCDPARGGRDCIGVCVPGRPSSRCPYDPTLRYVSRDPQQCMAIRFFCAEGAPFFNECGCGCRTSGPGGGTPCGNAFCGTGESCCNASCSRCVPHGYSCTQEVCEEE